MFVSERSWWLPVEPAVLWADITDPTSYPEWWPWLTLIEGTPLAPGAVVRCRVVPPLPYVVRLNITVERMDEPSSIHVTVSGDLEGRARLIVEGDGSGSQVTLASELQARRRLFRTLERVARPALVWGHDQVLDRGVAGYLRASG